MSLYDYRESLDIAAHDYQFYALIMGAMRKADTHNLIRLKSVFPQTWAELQQRYHAPGGVIGNEGPKQGVAHAESGGN